MVIKKKGANFQRTKFYTYVKLGKRQKSMRKYRRATGRHNKTRQKWRSRPPMVQIGYKNKVNQRGLIGGKTPVLVYNIADLNKVGKNNIIIVGKIGNKSKIELIKEIDKRKLSVQNVNVNKFFKQINKETNSKNEKSK